VAVEEGADQRDREALAHVLDQVGITRAKAKLLTMPPAVVWAAIAAIPAHYDHRAACVVKEASRLHALYLHGLWTPPARPRGEVDTQPMSTSTSPDRAAPNPHAALWQAVLARLQADIPDIEFETWLAPTALLALDASRAVVGAPNIFARDHIAVTHTEQLAAALAAAMGHVLTVEIVIDQEVAS
jgi:hypothetical protein